MVLGNATQKIQKMVVLAEELYERVTELREKLESMGEKIDETDTRIRSMETELQHQRQLITALAEEQGIDTAAVVTESDEETGPVDDSDTAVAADDGDSTDGEEAIGGVE